MTTFSQALQSCDMLLIDGLHAFDFVNDENGLRVECMDGRALKRWTFTAAQVQAAYAEGQDWLINSDSGEHRIVCLDALRASEEDEDDDETPAEPADR